MSPVRLTFASSLAEFSLIANSAAEALVLIAVQSERGARLVGSADVVTQEALNVDKLVERAECERSV